MDSWCSREIDLVKRNEGIDISSSRNRVSTETAGTPRKNDDPKNSLQSFSATPRPTKIPVSHNMRKTVGSCSKCGVKSDSFEVIGKMAEAIGKLKTENMSLLGQLDHIRREEAKRKLDLSKTAGSASPGESGKSERQQELLQLEVKSLKESLKQAQAKLTSAEIRLTRKEEEMGKVKDKELRLENECKEIRCKFERDIAEGEKEIKLRDKRIKQILEAYKRQLELVHVLRQQKLHLEAAHVIKYTEEEFVKTLDWKPLVKQTN